MITLVSASNRSQSLTHLFTRYASDYLKEEKGEEVQLLDLQDLSPLKICKEIYEPAFKSQEIENLKEKFFLPVQKFWFFIPEYNGSFPGILKLLLDIMSTRKREETFSGKKACLTGIASGRAGNLRGMDHFAEILNHLNIAVLPHKLPISSIHKLIDQDNNLIDTKTQDCLHEQADQFVSF